MCANLCHLIPMRSHEWPGSESSHPLTAHLRLHFMTRRRLLLNLLIQPFSVSSIRHNQRRRCSQQLPHSSPALNSSRSTHLSSALLFPSVRSNGSCAPCHVCAFTSRATHTCSSLRSMPWNRTMFYFPNPYSERTFCFRFGDKVAKGLDL